MPASIALLSWCEMGDPQTRAAALLGVLLGLAACGDSAAGVAPAESLDGGDAEADASFGNPEPVAMIDPSAPADDGRIWVDSSVQIDWVLTGPEGHVVCEAATSADALTLDQLDGLAALVLMRDEVRAGCDTPTYQVTVQDADGSEATYFADQPGCRAGWVLPFAEFDSWAHEFGCASER